MSGPGADHLCVGFLFSIVPLPKGLAFSVRVVYNIIIITIYRR